VGLRLGLGHQGVVVEAVTVVVIVTRLQAWVVVQQCWWACGGASSRLRCGEVCVQRSPGLAEEDTQLVHLPSKGRGAHLLFLCLALRGVHWKWRACACVSERERDREGQTRESK